MENRLLGPFATAVQRLKTVKYRNEIEPMHVQDNQSADAPIETLISLDRPTQSGIERKDT
jgi:hypothetical protein